MAGIQNAGKRTTAARWRHAGEAAEGHHGGQAGDEVDWDRCEAMNPLLPVIVVLLLVIIGLIYYAAYLLDVVQLLKEKLNGN